MAMLLRLSLILIFVASGIALGGARGQMRVAGVVVLCAGEAVQVLWIDQRGEPVRRTHICPDMALSLMAAVALPASEPAPPHVGVRHLDPATARVLAAGRDGVAARARDPPARV